MTISSRGNQGCMCDIPGGQTALWEQLGRPCKLTDFKCPQCNGEGNGYNVEEWVEGALRSTTTQTYKEAERILEEWHRPGG